MYQVGKDILADALQDGFAHMCLYISEVYMSEKHHHNNHHGQPPDIDLPWTMVTCIYKQTTDTANHFYLHSLVTYHPRAWQLSYHFQCIIFCQVLGVLITFTIQTCDKVYIWFIYEKYKNINNTDKQVEGSATFFWGVIGNRFFSWRVVCESECYPFSEIYIYMHVWWKQARCLKF